MAENSKIEWTDHTFNPWVGCTKVSPACDNCYAESWAKRSGLVRWGNNPRRRTSSANWRKPLKWNLEAEAAGTRPKVFCSSLADVFDNHGSITSGWHGDLWHLIDSTPNLDWLLLTKRPQNIAKMLPESYGMPAWRDGWPNVWLGTTAENQEEANRRIPVLLGIPAKVRFISVEPMLGPVDLESADNGEDALTRECWGDCACPHPPAIGCRKHDESQQVGGLDWIICGGESGPNARAMNPDWARTLRDQCAEAGVAFFMKQMTKKAPIPNDLMVREFPMENGHD